MRRRPIDISERYCGQLHHCSQLQFRYDADMSSPDPVEAPNRFERRRQQNRAALLDAAIVLFQEFGVRGTKVEDICARADVAPRTFFNHFETREHLYEAIAQQRALQFADIVDAATAGQGELLERLHTLFVGIGDYLDARPVYSELVRLMLGLGVDGQSEVMRTRALGQAALRFVEDGVARGQITSRHAPDVLADIVIGSLYTAIINWSASDEYKLASNLDSTARALVDLLGRRSDEGAVDNPD